MKKKIFFCLIVLFVVCVNIVYADDAIEEELSDIEIGEVLETASSVDELKINSRIAVVYDRASKNIVWGKDENKRTAMASTTKIMTAIVVIENAALDDTVKISAKAACTGGSRLGLKKDDKISLRDLLYGLMLKSGNDAAVAIAEHVGGSVPAFANMMNEKAKALKLVDSHFTSPHGLDNPEHYTTAYELAKITDYALKNETFRKIVGTKNYTVTINGYPKNINNTNELLGVLDGVYGVKTGFTNNAGRCLVTAIKKEGMDLIVIVIKADTKKDRTRDSVDIINYIIKNYESVDIKDTVQNEFEKWCLMNKKRFTIEKARNKDFTIGRENLKNERIIIKKTDIDNINVEFNAIYYFSAPVEKDTILGEMKIFVKDNLIEIDKLFFNENIEKNNIYDYFFKCLKCFK